MTAEQYDLARVTKMAAENAGKLEYVAEMLARHTTALESIAAKLSTLDEQIAQLKAGSVGSTTALVETLGYAVGCVFDVLDVSPEDRAATLNRIATKWAQEIETVNGMLRVYSPGFNVDEIAKTD